MINWLVFTSVGEYDLVKIENRSGKRSQKLDQEIIKVRDWIPQIGLLPKVIPLKLVLDMVPSSSEDVTRAMRDHERPKGV